MSYTPEDWLSLMKEKVARVLEQRFGFSKEEQQSAQEHSADAYFQRLEWE
jgi:hypothetical protein